MEAGLIPTRYVNVAASVAYGDLPDPLFRTYTRLVGLAWRDREHEQTQLPVLTLEEAAVLCRLKPRAMRLHLLELARAGLLEYHGGPQALHIRILGGADVQRFAPVQSFARPDDDVVVAVDPLSLEQRQQQQHAGVQNFAQAPGRSEALPSEKQPPPARGQSSAHAQANRAALAACGVNVESREAQAVAVLAHVTPELIAAWHAELQARAGIRNLPGYLLHVLRTTAQAPRAETRGGARGAAPAMPPLAEQRALPVLPEALHVQLDALSFSGPREEIAALYAEEPEFVTAWATYCVQRCGELRNPAGFFRNALRGEAYPPEAVPVPTPAPALPVTTPPSDPAQTVWEQTLDELQLSLARGVFEAHLRGSRVVAAEEGRWVIGLRAAGSVPWCEQQLRPLIERTVRALSGTAQQCEFVVLGAGA